MTLHSNNSNGINFRFCGFRSKLKLSNHLGDKKCWRKATQIPISRSSRWWQSLAHTKTFQVMHPTLVWFSTICMGCLTTLLCEDYLRRRRTISSSASTLLCRSRRSKWQWLSNRYSPHLYRQFSTRIPFSSRRSIQLRLSKPSDSTSIRITINNWTLSLIKTKTITRTPKSHSSS